MMIKRILLTVGLLLIGTQAFPDAPGTQLPPDQLIQQTAKAMFSAVNGKKAELQKNPQELYDLVGNILLPHFDFAHASQLVLGKYWRTASEAQRKAFQEAFYKYLVHSYSDALIKGDYSEHNIQVEPWRDSGGNQTMVKTKVSRSDGPPVEVDYVLEKNQDGWKAFDVVIEGISYVLNYRNQFAPEIEQSGLDALIKRLDTDAIKAPSAATSQGKH